MKKEVPLVSYDELSTENSHFEVAYLSFQKALEIIRSAEYLKTYSKNHIYKHKPAVAVLALQALCDDPKEAAEFKKCTQAAMFEIVEEEAHVDEYNVDEGHLPVAPASDD